MNSVITDRQDTLYLALAYYKLGEYKNPLRIESFFSSMTVLIRDLLGRDYVSTADMREEIRHIVRNKDPQSFDESKFDKDWQDCYADERCSIAHGRKSKLTDLRTQNEYDEITNIVAEWTREVIYYYIDNFQNRK